MHFLVVDDCAKAFYRLMQSRSFATSVGRLAEGEGHHLSAIFLSLCENPDFEIPALASMSEAPSSGQSFAPVFIFGCPRSGTTMLASQLGAQHAAIALPEMHYVSWLASAKAENSDQVKRLYEKLQRDFSFRSTGMKYALGDFAAAMSQSDPAERLFSIVRAYMDRHGLPGQGVTHWIEHSPIHRERVWLLRQLFPGAKFIHIVRDPRAVFVSMNSMAKWNTHDPLKFAKFWANAVSRGYLHAREMPEQVTEVVYENYLRDPVGELQRLCDFVGLSYEESMLNGGGVNLPQFTRRQHALTVQPPSVEKLSDWKAKISPRYAEVIEAYCQPWMYSYGYLDDQWQSRSANRAERRAFALRQLALTPYSKLVRILEEKL